MTPCERLLQQLGAITLAMGLAGAQLAHAQATSPANGSTVEAKPLPGGPATSSDAPATTAPASLLDQPASSAKIQLDGGRLSIQATNSSLTELIRQVAAQTGMQVEGDSRDERIFGVYGPGSPPEVLSALLYDSGYNVMMVGRMADGAPRRLVLSARAAGGGAPQNSTQQASHNDDDDDSSDAPVEAAQPVPPPNPGLQPGPAAPGANGQVKTPQQMLEELQRMHSGQQPQEIPRD